jgi:hypothetical protein
MVNRSDHRHDTPPYNRRQHDRCERSPKTQHVHVSSAGGPRPNLRDARMRPQTAHQPVNTARILAPPVCARKSRAGSHVAERRAPFAVAGGQHTDKSRGQAVIRDPRIGPVLRSTASALRKTTRAGSPQTTRLRKFSYPDCGSPASLPVASLKQNSIEPAPHDPRTLLPFQSGRPPERAPHLPSPAEGQ